MHRIIERTIEPSANRTSGLGSRAKARSREAARMGAASATHRARGESPGNPSSSQTLAGSTARTAARLRSSSPLASRTITTPLSLCTEPTRACVRNSTPRRRSAIVQTVDKRLPAAVDVPHIASQHEL